MPLTFVGHQTISYPGQQPLHANMYADNTGYWFGDAGQLLRLNSAGQRQSSGDITLQLADTSARIWGLDRDSDGNWAILIRPTGTPSIIGMLEIYTSTGEFVRSTSIPAVVTGLNSSSTPFRAPKAVFEIDGNHYVRVVRGDGVVNMRFLKIDSDGVVSAEDLEVDNADIDRLSDAASGNENGFYIIKQDTRVLYAIDFPSFREIPSLRTQLNTENTQPFALSIHEDRAYVGDTGGRAYVYSGAEIEEQKTTETQRPGLPLLQLWHVFQRRRQSFNLRDQEERRRLGIP